MNPFRHFGGTEDGPIASPLRTQESAAQGKVDI